MKYGAAATVLLVLLVLMAGHVPKAEAEVQFPKPDRSNADENALKEFQGFYDQVEAALAAEDLDRLMNFYAEDYLHHGITKKQLRFMWLEIFGEFSGLYSVHIFSKIDVHGNDAVLICTGALLGVPPEGGDYQAVDRWVNQNHWLTKIDGEWRMIGGATHQSPARTGSQSLELHPLF
jgi:ketosteroid isomerase-like protein